MTAPDFPPEEYAARITRAQALMQSEGLGAILLTTPQDILYITGFLTRFWESPTRPWFVVLPASGGPVAVIPAIGAALMARTHVQDIRTWRAPDYDDDGIGLLASTFAELVPPGARIGVPDQMESHVRIPLSDLRRLETLLGKPLASDATIMRQLRLIKSPAEIDRIAAACATANRAFDRVAEIARVGTPLSQVFRDFQALCLQEGADWVPYLAGGAGQGGYEDVISPATDKPLEAGDVLMLDTGLVRDGYFCDFDRNFSLGAPFDPVASAHALLIEATQAGFATAKPGATAADLFHAMNHIVNPGASGSDAGRLGHGLGLHLTEWPSLIPRDHTELVPGMILTLEPGIDMGHGRIMVHEENIVVTHKGAEWLSAPSGPEIRRIG